MWGRGRGRRLRAKGNARLEVVSGASEASSNGRLAAQPPDIEANRSGVPPLVPRPHNKRRRSKAARSDETPGGSRLHICLVFELVFVACLAATRGFT